MTCLRVKAQKWHKSRWCRLFGHVISGYHGDVPYLRKNGHGAKDGMGIRHNHLEAKCDHCGERITVAMIREKSAILERNGHAD